MSLTDPNLDQHRLTRKGNQLVWALSEQSKASYHRYHRKNGGSGGGLLRVAAGDAVLPHSIDSHDRRLRLGVRAASSCAKSRRNYTPRAKANR